MKPQSQGLPVVVAPIILYSDDTSGNVSKKWNKFDCWLLSMGGLPSHEARKFQNIHFVACSNKLSALKMADNLVDNLMSLESGITVYDAWMKQKVIAICPVLCILCDNVRAAELVNHLGSRTNLLCRMCMVINISA